MTARRDELLSTLWGGSDPFADHTAFEGRVDHQGWASDNPMLRQTIRKVRPRTVIEVGVWKGGSVLTMADEIEILGLDAVLIAIDTWLGAADHWWQPEWKASLRIENGYPTLFKTFAANVFDWTKQHIVLPLPLDSLNAADLLAYYKIAIDVAHVDGGHSFESVMADLRTWWPIIQPNGALIGDDYHPIGVEVWPQVRAAFHEFFKTDAIDNIGGKCVIGKAPDGTPILQGFLPPLS